MILKEDEMEEAWLLQNTQGKLNMVKDLYHIFKIDLSKTQERIKTDILEVLYIEEDMSLRRSLRGVYTTEYPNKVLDGEIL